MSFWFLPVAAVFLAALGAQESPAGPARQTERSGDLKEAFAAGVQAENADDWQAALAAFRQAAALAPKQFPVWFHLAEAAEKLAKQTADSAQREQLRAESVAAFDKAVALKPNDPAVHNNYALALAAAGNYVAAREHLDTAVRLDPQKAGQYYYNLGAVAVNDGRTQEGCDAFAAAVKADPNYPESHYQTGVCAFYRATVKGDGTTDIPPDARRSLSEYLRLSPAGQFVEIAKELVASLDSPIEMDYVRPGYSGPPPPEPPRIYAALLKRGGQPGYPPLAKRARLQGVVLLDAVIDRNGDIAALRVVSGHPLLVRAAMEAAKQWKFRPTLRNGEAVVVAFAISVNFQLSP
jgi:TonB family protein